MNLLSLSAAGVVPGGVFNSLMEQFNEILREIFGPRETEFSKELRNRLWLLWADGFEWGGDLPHVCGNFDPSSQGAIGPENCDACQTQAGLDS